MPITLFHHPGSLCSQKVRLALAEKGVPFESRVVDIGPRAENYERWYAELNPRMVVPTLVHDGRVVTDSARIVRYIDEQFAGPVLRAETDEARSIEDAWIALADSLPLRELSYGTLRGPFGWILRHSDRVRLRKLERGRDANPDLAPLYQARIDDVRQWFEVSRNPRKVSELVDSVNATLAKLDAHIRQRAFIAGAHYGLADILWTVVIARLYALGLRSTVDAHRNVARYFARIEQRPSLARAGVWKSVPWGVILRSLFRLDANATRASVAS